MGNIGSHRAKLVLMLKDNKTINRKQEAWVCVDKTKVLQDGQKFLVG
jgi:hypothetical protein